MAKQSMAIICSACNADTFVRREPVYEGFTKTGEIISCVSCGHTFADEADVPFKDTSGPQIFTEADRSKTLDVFKGDEKGHNCRHCRHYTVNPFIQRCGFHKVEVQASDVCDDFSPKGEEEADEDPLAKLLKG
jgi:hypothetical protein